MYNNDIFHRLALWWVTSSACRSSSTKVWEMFLLQLRVEKLANKHCLRTFLSSKLLDSAVHMFHVYLVAIRTWFFNNKTCIYSFECAIFVFLLNVLQDLCVCFTCSNNVFSWCARQQLHVAFLLVASHHLPHIMLILLISWDWMYIRGFVTLNSTGMLFSEVNSSSLLSTHIWAGPSQHLSWFTMKDITILIYNERHHI